MSAELFFRTMPIGLAVAMPVGAMGVLCIERTLKRGWLAGLMTGLGIAAADAAYASIAAFGVKGVSAVLLQWNNPLRIVGGAALIVIGLRSALRGGVGGAAATTTKRSAADATPPPGTGHAGLFGSALVLTLANPMTIIAFAGIFLGVGLSGEGGATGALAATLGVACGSLLWWCALVSGTTLMRKGLPGASSAWLARSSGALLCGFGAYAIISAFAGGVAI
jgi:putative LysE/RhtB family amino acid efflux pump